MNLAEAVRQWRGQGMGMQRIADIDVRAGAIRDHSPK